MILKELEMLKTAVDNIDDKEIADLFVNTFVETANYVRHCHPDKAKEMLKQIRKNAEAYTELEAEKTGKTLPAKDEVDMRILKGKEIYDSGI